MGDYDKQTQSMIRTTSSSDPSLVWGDSRICELPFDAIGEVMSYFTVNDLWQCACVSKVFRSWYTDPWAVQVILQIVLGREDVSSDTRVDALNLITVLRSVSVRAFHGLALPLIHIEVISPAIIRRQNSSEHRPMLSSNGLWNYFTDRSYVNQHDMPTLSSDIVRWICSYHDNSCFIGYLIIRSLEIPYIGPWPQNPKFPMTSDLDLVCVMNLSECPIVCGKKDLEGCWFYNLWRCFS